MALFCMRTKYIKARVHVPFEFVYIVYRSGGGPNFGKNGLVRFHGVPVPNRLEVRLQHERLAGPNLTDSISLHDRQKLFT